MIHHRPGSRRLPWQNPSFDVKVRASTTLAPTSARAPGEPGENTRMIGQGKAYTGCIAIFIQVDVNANLVVTDVAQQLGENLVRSGHANPANRVGSGALFRCAGALASQPSSASRRAFFASAPRFSRF